MDDQASRRRFRLSDGLILIAGAAAGMGTMRVYFPDGFNPGPFVSVRSFPPALVHLYVATLRGLGLLPIPAGLTLAVLAARFMPPRPSRRRFASQPGASACLVVAIGVTLTVLGRLAIEGTFRLGWPPPMPVPKSFASDILNLRNSARILPMAIPPLAFGPMIACVWVNLWIGHRWRPERSWVDRAGRMLGVFWMLWSLPHLWFLVVDL